jgi:hypothetical protein
MNKFSLKIQIILSYASIAMAAIISIYGLGFMTGFYTLFMNGNDEMYTFYKDIQVLNSALFSSGLIFLVLSFLLIGFDINKKVAGIFGVLFTLALTITNIINGISIFSANSVFLSAYNQLDFAYIEGYVASTLPFKLAYILFGTAIVMTLLLFALTTGNFVAEKKKGKISEK